MERQTTHMANGGLVTRCWWVYYVGGAQCCEHGLDLAHLTETGGNSIKTNKLLTEPSSKIPLKCKLVKQRYKFP